MGQCAKIMTRVEMYSESVIIMIIGGGGELVLTDVPKSIVIGLSVRPIGMIFICYRITIMLNQFWQSQIRCEISIIN